MATGKQILGFTLLLIGITLAVIGASQLILPAYYKATTRIEISSDLPSVQDNSSNVAYGGYFIQTEFAKMQSELVLGNVVTNLHLKGLWAKKPGPGNRLRVEEAIALLKQRMEIRPERNNRLIDVSFYSTDPKEASDVANAIVSAYNDYRLQQWKTNVAIGIKALEEEYQEEEQKIRITQTNLDVLRTQLNVPAPEPDDDTLKSAYPSYHEQKQNLQKLIDLHKLLQAKITNEKVDSQLPKSSMIEIVDAAQPPKFPVKPNRYLGIFLFAIGIMMAGFGWRLLRSPRQS